jgi:hypothetical protein
MKRSLLTSAIIASLAIIFAACNTNPVQVNAIPVADTTGFAQFQAWKVMEQQPAMPIPQQRASAPAKNYSMNSASTHEAKTAKTAKKKGWSKAAKYSVIGGAGGAVLGAIIHKKSPVKGGIIGAVILGGGGYIFGRSQDKKDGRIK